MKLLGRITLKNGFFLVAAVVFSLCGVYQVVYYYRGEIREQVRMYFPSTPLIRHTLSYYSPQNPPETYDLAYGFIPKEQKIAGKPFPAPLLVIDDVGWHYLLISPEGKIEQMEYVQSIGKSVGMDDKFIYVPAAKEIWVLRRSDLKKVDVWPLDFYAQFVQIQQNYLITADESHVHIYDISDHAHIKHIYQDPTVSQAARGADLQGSMLVVSDTYGDRVYGIDIRDNERLFQIKVAVPNSVHFVGPGKILLTEEHVNRVTTYDIIKKQYKLLMGCPLVFHNEKFYTFKQVQALQSPLVPPPSEQLHNPPESLCAEENIGIETLYSPNGAREMMGGHLIADTDNHRVLFVKDGIIQTILYGLNNPVDAVFLN